MTSLKVLLAVAALQIVSACKNCVMLGKEEKAMFRAHSDACIAQSGVDPKLVDGLLAGQLEDVPELRRHVYCVLVKCKLVGKDGKLLKSAVFGKLATRMDGRNATKVLENCASQVSGAFSPEDIAWNLFRCGYDRKAVLFDYMPPAHTQQETQSWWHRGARWLAAPALLVAALEAASDAGDAMLAAALRGTAEPGRVIAQTAAAGLLVTVEILVWYFIAKFFEYNPPQLEVVKKEAC